MQAANTGLTGGSTPDGDGYDRDVVIVNTMRLTGIHVIDDGRQAICLPGSTLYELEEALEPYGREPHSVIGSSCFGASVIGGICNNSGGTLIKRGPAFTQLAAYAQVDGGGKVRFVNHLGVKLGTEPENILCRLENGEFRDSDIDYPANSWASDRDYINRIRKLDSKTPARFNADDSRLFEASGSAGRIVVFAVRVDTFPKDFDKQTYYIGTNNADALSEIRVEMLSTCENLPISAEYMHRDLFDVAAEYGKDLFLVIRLLGAKSMPKLFRLKARLESRSLRRGVSASGVIDRILQRISRLFPDHLPKRVRQFRERYEHYLILTTTSIGATEAEACLMKVLGLTDGAYFRCTPEESKKALLHRFVAAGAAVRFGAVHADEVEGILSLDFALRPNDDNWNECLPESISRKLVGGLYYAHFFCHVFHHDYIVKKGFDIAELKKDMLQLLELRGAEYPAEHNVGHTYSAKPNLVNFYRTLDPTNSLNPGIGQTSKNWRWRREAGEDKERPEAQK